MSARRRRGETSVAEDYESARIPEAVKSAGREAIARVDVIDTNRRKERRRATRTDTPGRRKRR